MKLSNKNKDFDCLTHSFLFERKTFRTTEVSIASVAKEFSSTESELKKSDKGEKMLKGVLHIFKIGFLLLLTIAHLIFFGVPAVTRFRWLREIKPKQAVYDKSP